jgi:hypothetical protein
MIVFTKNWEFEIVVKIKPGAQNWLCSQDEKFYATGIINLLGQWKTCVSVMENILKRSGHSGLFICFARK